MIKTFIRLAMIATSSLTLLGYGCTHNQPSISKDLQESFQKLIVIEDMNKSLLVSIDASEQRYIKFDTDIRIIIENLSDKKILIPEPDGIKLLIVRNNEWVEVNDATEYYGNSEGPVLFPSAPLELKSRTTTWIHPYLNPEFDYTKESETLRVVIIGKIISDGEKTGELVSAYADVSIEP
ncbi:MAG: hypothetical protein ACOYYU_04270 [Chloroflexota bacterium]